jgi:hypothetical protein
LRPLVITIRHSPTTISEGNNLTQRLNGVRLAKEINCG